MLTIEEKIARSERFAKLCGQAEIPEWQEECEQLAAWLRELKETRKERDYWREKAHSYEQTIFKLTDSISKQPEIVRCGECVNFAKRDFCKVAGHNVHRKSNCMQVFGAERRTDG